MDHPSQIEDTLYWIHYIKLSMIEHRRKVPKHTSITLSVMVSRWITFVFTAPAIQDFLDMSLSCILGFKQKIKPHTVGHSTKQKGWRIKLSELNFDRHWALTMSHITIIASKCSWIPAFLTGKIRGGLVDFWAYFSMLCYCKLQK